MKRQKILLITFAVVFCLFIVGYIVVVRPMVTQKAPEGETSLETPADLESAVKTFINKTRW